MVARLPQRFSRGFTLVEVLVVTAIVGMVSAFLSGQFSRSRVDFNQATSSVIANIRSAQTLASSGRLHGGVFRCGFGIHFVSGSQYIVYAGPNAQAVDCTTDNRNYDGGTLDVVVTTVTLGIEKYDFAAPLALDVFFEPPDPTTYINNQSLGTTPPARIIVHKTGANCSADASQCRAICVYRSGKIQVAQTWTTCP